MNTYEIGTFNGPKIVIERVNPLNNLSATNMQEVEFFNEFKLFIEGKVFRYILVKLIYERLGKYEIFGGKKPFQKMENPPKTAVKGKDWERASYIVRSSSNRSE